MAQSLKEVAVEIALQEAKHGVYEDNNDNRGTRIDEYATAADQTPGDKWCVMFVYWCYAEAAKRLATRSPLPKIFGAEALESWARLSGKLQKTPMLGDILIKGHHHAGLVTGPAVGKMFPSIEGNTWAKTTFENRREGVYVLNKELVNNCTFVRF